MWSHSIYKGSLLCFCCLSFGVKLQEVINYIYQFLLQLLFTKKIMLLYLLTVTLGIDLMALGLHQTRLWQCL